jgi:glycosyltransferase involved in cell wall biosynthesis
MAVEVIVVDDGSTDGTGAAVEEFCAQNRELALTLVRLSRNSGKGRALREGFRLARGDIVLVQDADAEYDPVMNYPTLLTPFFDQRRADVVYGSRFLAPSSIRPLYFWHLVGNRFLTLITNLCTGLILTDMETGYKVFRRLVVASLLPILRSDDFGIEPEITLKVAHRGWRLFEVPIVYTSRTYEEGKKIGWRDGFRAIRVILAATFFDR